MMRWLQENGVREQALFGTLAILAFAAIGSQLVNRLCQLLCKATKLLRIGPRNVAYLTRALNSLVWICATMMILEAWGVGVAGLWSLLINVVAVIGVGFLAVWTIISNITASLIITIWRPFRLDDTLELLPENVKGRVIDRNLFFTVLQEKEDVTIQIPNNLFFQKIFRVVRKADQYRFAFTDDAHKRIPDDLEADALLARNSELPAEESRHRANLAH